MDKNDFLTHLEKNDILKFGEFTLASGAKSEFYIDLRVIPFIPDFFSTVMEQFAEKLLSETDFDVVCGIPLAGLPFATMVAYYTKKPLVLIRKTPKDHGLKKMIEGGDVKGKKVLVIDDLVSSGFSKEFAIEELRKEEAVVTTLGVIIDRREDRTKAQQWEKSKEVKVVSLFQLPAEEILAYRKAQK